jgi:hypothetical protein
MQRMVRHFRELRVYQDAFGAAMTIFQLSRSWPQEERYAHSCGYLSKEQLSELDQVYECVSGGLVTMMDNAEGWCGPAKKLPHPHTPKRTHS